MIRAFSLLASLCAAFAIEPCWAETPVPAADLKPSTLVAYASLKECASDVALTEEGRQQLLEAKRLAYVRALEIDPKFIPAHVGLANWYDKVGNHAKALATYQHALELTATDKVKALWFHLGMCHARHKDWGPAIESLRKAHELDPDDRQCAKTLGLCLVKAGRIHESIALPVSPDFHDVSLKQVIEELRKCTGVALVFDQPEMDKAGIDIDQTHITMRLELVSLRSALALILHQAGLAMVVKDDFVLITSEWSLRQNVAESSYCVSDLIFTPEYDGDWEQCVAGQSVEDLMALIANAIAPDSWTSAGGKGTVAFDPEAKTLQIAQTPDMQEQVQELLDALRRPCDSGGGPWDYLHYVPKWNRTVLPEEWSVCVPSWPL
jgi:Tetratricopeptide repeat